MARAKKLSFQTLMEENKKELLQDEKMTHNIIDRIEDRIHATVKGNIYS